MKIQKIVLIGVLFGLLFAENPTVRIKDIASVAGIRSNQIMGVGLVVGLKGTGDSSLVFTDKALTNLLTNMGGSTQKTSYKSKNVAAVIVTADLPPFLKPGQKIDVFVSSVGDATSLKDGTLLMTPLKGPDDLVYAVAQGPVLFGGRAAQGGSSAKTETVCKVMEGAVLEQVVPMDFIVKNKINLVLKRADFTTAVRIAQTLDKNGFAGAKAIDPVTVELPVTVEDKDNIVAFVAQIEELSIVPDMVAKVVINQRTGTVVIGEQVRLSPVAIAHSDIEIKIEDTKMQKQTNDFAAQLMQDTNTDEAVIAQAPVAETPATTEEGDGSAIEGAAAAPETQNAARVAAAQPETQTTRAKASTSKKPGLRVVQLKAGSSLSSLVKALNTIGVTPEDLVAIIQALKQAGSLNAEVEVI